MILRYLSLLSGTACPSSIEYHRPPKCIIVISGFEIISVSKAPSLDNDKNPPTKVVLSLVKETNLYKVPREIQNIKVYISVVAIISKQISL